jgi:hypothetical protein
LDFGDDHFTIGSWEQKDFISKNGQMKLSTQVFFASIDQRSENGLDQASWVVKMFATEICNLPIVNCNLRVYGGRQRELKLQF